MLQPQFRFWGLRRRRNRRISLTIWQWEWWLHGRRGGGKGKLTDILSLTFNFFLLFSWTIDFWFNIMPITVQRFICMQLIFFSYSFNWFISTATWLFAWNYLLYDVANFWLSTISHYTLLITLNFCSKSELAPTSLLSRMPWPCLHPMWWQCSFFHWNLFQWLIFSKETYNNKLVRNWLWFIWASYCHSHRWWFLLFH